MGSFVLYIVESAQNLTLEKFQGRRKSIWGPCSNNSKCSTASWSVPQSVCHWLCVCVCVTVCACVCICFRCSDKIESRSWGVHSLLQILARRITKGIHSASLNCPTDWFQVAVFFLGLRLGQSTYAKPCECDCPSTALLEEFKHVDSLVVVQLYSHGRFNKNELKLK